MQISIRDYVRYAWQLVNGLRSHGELDIARRRNCDIQSYVEVKNQSRVLDLANGRLRPQYTILKSFGHQVYGIDRCNRPTFDWNNVAYRFARGIFSWRINGLGWSEDSVTLVCGDVSSLPFKQDTFNLVTSVAAFEHFLDVSRVIQELKRVLCPGGIAWVAIHLFSSLSGAHNLSVTEFPLRRIPKGVDAWDHLRERRLPFYVPLNEWRRDRYLDEFAKQFQIVNHYCAMREGEELLTPDIEAELSSYSRDELTCNAYIIVARKTS